MPSIDLAPRTRLAACGRVTHIRKDGRGRAEVTLLSGGKSSTRIVDLPADVIEAGDLVLIDDQHPGPRLRLIAKASQPLCPEGDALRWSRGDRMAMLEARHRAIRAIRNWFDDQYFIEVQTPLVLTAPCPDRHIESMRVEDGWLATSTEFQLKRLVVGGFERVYTLTQNFRQGELGRLHNPEFTMLEWCRACRGLDCIEDDARAIVLAAAEALGCPDRITYAGNVIDLSAPWGRLSIRDAFAGVFGISLPAGFGVDEIAEGTRGAGLLDEALVDADPDVIASWSIDRLQSLLGKDRPTFLVDWPSGLTSSAPEVDGISPRSELIIGGVEIGDGFPFWTDAAAQRARLEACSVRQLDERYLAALEEGLYPGAGMAIGIDRLLMVLLDARHIREVTAFAWDER